MAISPLLLSAAVFGLSGGITPGPLLTLVISETLKDGVRAGLKIAAAPLITDLPIAAAALLVLSRLPDTDSVMAAIWVAGGLYLGHLSLEGIRFAGYLPAEVKSRSGPLLKGVTANFLNPSPYIFWSTVGGPGLTSCLRAGPEYGMAYILIFYSLLTGSKMLLAVLVSRAGGILSARGYIYTNRILGWLLLIFAFYFLKNGLGLLV